MPMQNRVTPLGDVVAVPLRGAWLGNRGILHEGTRVVRFHRSPLWIICELEFKGWTAPKWEPHRYTALFFHDEAVALAAGHRPCALCRRGSYNTYRRAMSGADPLPLAKEIDRQLHGERLFRGTHRRRLHPRPWRDLPVGTFVMADGAPALVGPDSLVPWTIEGYSAPRSRPLSGTAEVITPPSTMVALTNGYRPQVDPAAGIEEGVSWLVRE